uniref:Uncharacterized protein n=1 Tax=Arundo donax TaxID=35708 RepID=A0A0A9BZ14_ARUDO
MNPTDSEESTPTPSPPPPTHVLQSHRHPLLHLAANDFDGAVPGQRVVRGLEPLANLHVREQIGVAKRCRRADHRLQVDLGLPHYVVL